jgi:hypothetical protein
MADRHCIEILIPGLLGPIPIAPDELPPTPVLARLLGRADPLPGGESDPVAALLGRFGVASDADADADADLPSAPFCRLVEGGEPGAAGFLMHADPVHLRADRDRLLLFDARHLGVTVEEAAALVDLFNAHFVQDGLRLEAPVPQRWYLHLPRPPRIHTHPLHAATGRGIAGFLPAGEEAAGWAGRLNEVQMLFHHAQVNVRREAEGRPTVNGIWPWGGGHFPPPLDGSGYARVLGEHPLALGLAVAAGIPAEPLPKDGGSLLAGGGDGDVLVLWDRLWPAALDADPVGWCKEVQRLDAWLAPLADGLGRRGQIRVELDPCNGERYRLDRKALRRFWRRPLRLAERVVASTPSARP